MYDCIDYDVEIYIHIYMYMYIVEVQIFLNYNSRNITRIKQNAIKFFLDFLM